jgi:hypothetical protein
VQTVTTASFSAPSQITLAPADALCSSGRRPLGGGYELIGGAQQLTVLSSAPLTGTAGGWRVTFRNQTATMLAPGQVRVHVVCAVVQ